MGEKRTDEFIVYYKIKSRYPELNKVKAEDLLPGKIIYANFISSVNGPTLCIVGYNGLNRSLNREYTKNQINC